MTSWDVSDWSYTAEGGKHAIFRYSPSSTTLATDNNEFHGHVLRIAKSGLVSSFHVNEEESTSTSTPYQIPNDCKSSSQTFQKNIIQPLIGCQYIDIGHTVHLPTSFCSQLYQQTISSGLIPNARLSSWQKKNCNGSVCNEKGIAALLLRDYTSYLSPPSPSASQQLQSKSSSSKMFSVEIKPKAGFITTSPLVLPNHRCKYQSTRYALQQELMRLGVMQKGWQQQRQITSTSEEGCGFTPSQYSPLNLFSNDINQIHKAISDLMNNMQNNIRIWYDGIGLGSDDVAVGFDEMILNDLLDSDDDSKPATTDNTNIRDAVTRIVSTILYHEQDLLSNILSKQQLDVIDGDGAVMIYERLVQLCNGSNVEAEALLDEALLVPSVDFAVDAVEKKQSNVYHSITESSPYTFPQHCKSLRKLLDEIEKFDKYMRDHHLQNKEAAAVHDDYNGNITLDESIVDAAHIKSMDHINHLSKEGCIYLLQNWLLSLVLCDISFFITFRVVSIECDHQEVVTKCQSDDQSGIVVCLLPTKNDAPSTLSSTSSSSVAIQYEVKVVDCDPKPAKKLRGRKEIENKFSI